MKWSWLAILFLGAVAPISAQTKDPSTDDLAFFEKRVRPLLAEHCYSCHSQAQNKKQGGLWLDDPRGLLVGDSGPVAIPGKPRESRLIDAVHYSGKTTKAMPPQGKLSPRNLAILEEWVIRGVPMPIRNSTQVAKAPSIEEGRSFWSFQPLRNVAPPANGEATRIDRFLQAEREKRGLKSGPAASRAALLRRTKFDLLGLPPTPEEITAFVNDTAPDAHERWVERWLASPQYGERWARFWLDLARYCDIPESWADVKGQPYLYRDWVVQALNRDVPYDRFILLQLAADLLPDGDPADRAALGFLGLSPSYWKELQLPPEIIKEIVADEYEERIHTFSSTFLGLNVACARCHDHKFDPISIEDYYGLAGVFASTRTSDLAILKGVSTEKIVQARNQMKEYETALKKWQTQKTPDAPIKAEEFKKKIEDLKRNQPDWNTPLAPGVIEASLSVEPAKGHGSVLVYKPGQPQDLALHLRGNPNRLGPIVPRRFLSVLSREGPIPFKQGSGRLELARALVNEAAPLTARVFVNRIWKQHFGVGLVETPSDFGTQGERPSHPDLLDDLASRFIQNGWSLKWLHKEIMLTSAYRLSSGPGLAGDEDYRYLTRMPRRRLEVEAWRDAILFVTGSLDLTQGGPPMDLSLEGNRRRTLYGTVKRRELADLLRLHDFPDPITHSPNRVPTTTPLQQLYLLNSPFMVQQSTALVKRLQTEAGEDAEKRIGRAYELLFGRSPRATELRLGLEFVKDRPATSWPQYAQVLLGSNEFLFVE